MFNMEENELNYLQKAYELCDQKEYELAKTIFAKYLKINENDYHANLGMVRALTHDYSKENVAEDFEFYFQKALAVAPIQEKSKILKKYNTYVENLNLSQHLDNLMNASKKGSFISNFYVFLISCCFVIGVFFFISKQWLLGSLLFGVAIFIVIINYLSNLLKRKGDKND